MPDHTTDRWVYYKIYFGEPGRADYLVTGPLAQISRLPDVRQWFFLHYTDGSGPHLRLRVQAHQDPGQLEKQAGRILEQALAQLPTVPPSPYRPTILPPAPPAPGPDEADGGSPLVRLQLDRYVPDAESFGEKGVLIAEHLSCASSEAAVRILTDEGRQRYSRKTLVPLLMHATASAFVPDAGPTLWRDYASYWMTYAPELEAEWMPRFAAKAGELRAEGVSVVMADGETPVGAVEVLDAWRDAASVSADAFRSTGDDPPRSPRDLTFHFLHLMNNRLGLAPLEEAYFATLIALDRGIDGIGSDERA